MLKIILNADDFGKSPARNRAINELLIQGRITSAGLIVTGKHLQEAADMISAGGYPEKVHLHINLSTNQLQEDSEDIPLTDAMRRDRFFCRDGKFSLYRGLPRRFKSIFKWKTVYHEIVAQYEKFIEVTHGLGDNAHVDFHLWYNLTWPVSVALNLFTWKYHIKTVRYIGVHQQKQLRYRVYRAISWNPKVKCIPATNLDFFFSKRSLFEKTDMIELYCHPHYKGGILLDDSPSYLKHERQPMENHLRIIRDIPDVEFIPWNVVR